MRVYITARFKGNQNKDEILALCAAVNAAGMQDFSFQRDVENFKPVFTNPQALWERSKLEVQKSDALLIDASDQPTSGRIVELGMAYARNMPIFVIAKHGTYLKPFFEGVATKLIFYNDLSEVTKQLKDSLRQK